MLTHHAAANLSNDSTAMFGCVLRPFLIQSWISARWCLLSRACLAPFKSMKPALPSNTLYPTMTSSQQPLMPLYSSMYFSKVANHPRHLSGRTSDLSVTQKGAWSKISSSELGILPSISCSEMTSSAGTCLSSSFSATLPPFTGTPSPS